MEGVRPILASKGSFSDLIGPSEGRPRAILFRQVATPNYELRRFLRVCRRQRFEPVILRYHADKMSCHNQFKRSLVHPMFVKGIGKGGKPYFVKRHLLRIDTVDNFPMREITLAGKSLPDFHDCLLKDALTGFDVRTIEGSDWFGKYSRGARDYYVEIFSQLNGGMVLFEDYSSDKLEAEFFEGVVRPAYNAACAITGERPAIIPLCPNRRMVSPLWYAYPESYWPMFQKMGAEG